MEGFHTMVNKSDNPTKRPRAPNFSAFSEYCILIDLVDKYKAMIESKKTDGVTLKEKLELMEIKKQTAREKLKYWK